MNLAAGLCTIRDQNSALLVIPYRTGKETKMCLSGPVLLENRHGLVVDVELTKASGTSEREAASRMLKRMRQRVGRRRCTLGADKGYDTHDFLQACQELRVTPHVARRESFWGSALLAKLAPTARDHLKLPRADH
jgi:hypothetical protein